MGIEVDRTEFSDEDRAAFGRRLGENLAALRGLLSTPGFGEGPGSLGAELEVSLIDERGDARFANQEILADAGDPRLTLELNRYNLEFNLSPQPLDRSPFLALERELGECLRGLEPVAAAHGARVVPIGILPTLRREDFGPHAVTNCRRYHALQAQLVRLRGDRFKVELDGDEPLSLEMGDITLEGANTSFQVHYRVPPRDYADVFNAVQLATPVALAISGNSPTLFGHRLWHETRVPLFKKSIDTRHAGREHWHEPPRVSFGQGWCRRGALELFEEVACLYPPLIPVCAPGGVEAPTPRLSELRLHQGTVWLWNRPIYDDAAGGHLRVEMRALPAGPSAVDMAANAAFLIGLAEGLRPRIDALLPALPFSKAEHNFYRAAQHGLGARLVWPDPSHMGLREYPVTALIASLLPIAASGLDAIGIDGAESSRYLGVIEERLGRAQTGASWQRDVLASLRGERSREDALHEMLARYVEHSGANLPVAQWPR